MKPGAILERILIGLLIGYCAAQFGQVIAWLAWHRPAWPLIRFSGATPNANLQAFILLFALAYAVRYRSWWTTGIIAVLLLLTGSRVNITAAVLGAGIFVLLDKQTRQRFKPVYVMPALVFTAVGFGSVYVMQLSDIHQNIVPATFGMRLEHYRLAWQMFRSAPLTGTGYGNFRWGLYAMRENHLLTDPYVYSHAHSLWLTVLAETGLIGFLPVGITTTLASLTVLNLNDKQRPLAAALLAAVLFSLTFDYYFWYLPTLAITGLALFTLARRPLAWRLSAWWAVAVPVAVFSFVAGLNETFVMIMPAVVTLPTLRGGK